MKKAKVCILTRNTLIKDSRTLTEAQILARFGLNVTALGLWAKDLSQEEPRQGLTIKRIPPASYRLATSWIKRYRDLTKAMPLPFKRVLHRADPAISTAIRRIARAVNKPLNYGFLLSQAVREKADYYHAHFPLSIVVLAWIASILSRRPFIRDYNDIIVLEVDNQVISPGYYEQEVLWGRGLNEREIKRINDIIEMIPKDVGTILDVGCGDGRITNRLVGSYDRVVGLDISDTALQYVQTETVKASVDHIPFGDKSFDLVLATELLEHLPHPVYIRARKEIQRVARKWILVSLPWQESLKLGLVRCPRCGTVFHVNFHYRRFNRRKLERLFKPNFKMTAIKYTGGERRCYDPILLWVRQHIGGIWNRTPATVCPKCSLHLFPGQFPERNAISKLCDDWNARIMARRRPEKSHVVALYRRHR